MVVEYATFAACLKGARVAPMISIYKRCCKSEVKHVFKLTKLLATKFHATPSLHLREPCSAAGGLAEDPARFTEYLMNHERQTAATFEKLMKMISDKKDSLPSDVFAYVEVMLMKITREQEKRIAWLRLTQAEPQVGEDWGQMKTE
eukprot:TRINITY_DN3584_c0_g1_i1.p1 TRINITY_DN3584_c0_g1~~TRINITY_DN3584_c0_g1_i1.p1  ORF type:complete len:146 (-),score=52.72 TRINITY_DN3584_c0_g1_i1:54-491(-)